MIIARGSDMGIIHHLMEGEKSGTLFLADKEENFDLEKYLI